MGKRGFGELELTLLQLVKKLGRVTVRDVYEALGSKGSYTTIMTVMSRLAEKGELLRTKEGKIYIYWLAETKITTTKSIFRRLQDKIFGGKKLAMVSYLLENDQTISNQELDEIEQMIQTYRLKNKKND